MNKNVFKRLSTFGSKLLLVWTWNCV